MMRSKFRGVGLRARISRAVPVLKVSVQGNEPVRTATGGQPGCPPRMATGMCDPNRIHRDELMNSLHDVFRPKRGCTKLAHKIGS